MLSSVTILAQTYEDRAIIKKTIVNKDILDIQKTFHTQFQENQIRIKSYLEKNPNIKKTFEKNGNSYLLHHIDKDGNPIFINTKDINQITNSKSHVLYQGGSLGININGSGMIAGVWDGGQVNSNHELLLGQSTMEGNQSVNTAGGNDHMQAVSGIMVGKALSSSSNANNLGLTAKGIAYGATTKNYDWDNDLLEMLTFATDGYLISNHSYGYSNTTTNNIWNYGAYDSTAKNWDLLLKSTPFYLPFIAAGNEQQTSGNSSAAGFDIITGASAAKNVITVGAVDSNNAMSDYSNWGPTDDGRVKPDIVTLGTAINVPKYSGNDSYTGFDTSSSGTSYATPAAAAAALLLQQYYKSIFGNYMTAASLKALLLHTADDAGNAGPDAKFGWGILNVEKAANTIKQMQTGGSAKLVEFTTNPNNDSLDELTVSVLAGGGAARASICWTDDEGTEQTSSNGVNNTTSRLVYNFDVLFRKFGVPSVNSYTFSPLSISNPNATAVPGSNFFSNNVDNYKQANISSTAINDGLALYIRKANTSPSTVRNFSVLITGLKATSSTLSTMNTKIEKATVFYDLKDSKIKMIANDSSASFGEYTIYDITGRILKSGKERTNEIEFKNSTKGTYILVYNTKGHSEKFKFRN